MAHKFVAAGLRAAALDASSPRDERAEQIRRLRAGQLQILFAVDLFNEGLDIPEIDTVLFLRPTESHLVFLQQRWPGPPQLPLRPALPRPARRHARPAQTADRSGLSLPAGRLQPPARSRLQRAGAGEPARVVAQPPAPAARRSPPPRALLAGGIAGGAWDGAGGVLQGGGVLGVAAAGAGVEGRGGLG
ncbi:MAG: helicase-related protein [Cyanobium sp. CZS 48M]|nr:helicase-related protein [Cyanobium sp. CZS48M]